MESTINLYQNERIHYYKNAIKNPEELVEHIENSNDLEKWKWSSTTVHDMDQEPNTYQTYEFSEEKLLSSNILKDEVIELSKHYADIHGFELRDLTDVLISKCYPGKHTGPHVDSHGSEDSVKVSVLVFLNDNYEGGEMLFRKQKELIKPSAGGVLIYPSTEPFYHQPNLIRSGIKYVATCFWY
jgi:hypothetical protein